MGQSATVFTARAADAAFAVHAAMRRAEAATPSLRDNPHWSALSDAAYARFRAAFEALG